MRLMACGWEGRIQRGHFSPSQQACDWLPSVYYLRQKLVGGVPITYKTAAVFNKLNVHPHTTDKLKMSPSNIKHFKIGCSEGDYCLLVQLGCSRKHAEMLLQQFQAQMTAGPKWHRKISKAAITTWNIRNPRWWDQIILQVWSNYTHPWCHHT